MKWFGNCIVVGPSNNFLKMHGIRMRHRKRYPHEPKWIPKNARCRYHTMKRVGCKDELIVKFLKRDLNDEKLAIKIVNAYRKE